MTQSVTADILGEDIADSAHNLISSARIEGTPVFDRIGDRIGAVHSVMIDKRSGQVAYAVLTFGGFMGFGTRAYPIPWSMLRYSRDEHGYCLDVRREAIEAAPYMTLDEADRPQVTREPVYRHWDQYL